MRKKVIYILGAILILVLTSTASWFARGWAMDNEREQAIRFATQIADSIGADSELSSIYQSSTDGYKASNDQSYFEDSIRQARLDSVELITIGQVYKGYDDYMIQFNLSNAESEDQGALVVYVVKENGEWRISDIYS